jgi:hypothetical protein
MGSAAGKKAFLVLLMGFLVVVWLSTCNKGNPTSSDPPPKSPTVPNPPTLPTPPPLSPAPPPPEEWAHEYNLTFPVLSDWSENVHRNYATGWLPVNIILDRNMTIRAGFGDYDESAFLAVIKKYL